MLGDAILHLTLCLGEMQVNGDLMLLGKLLGKVQLIARNGVDSVWSHTPADPLRKLRKELLIAVAIVPI